MQTSPVLAALAMMRSACCDEHLKALQRLPQKAIDVDFEFSVKNIQVTMSDLSVKIQPAQVHITSSAQRLQDLAKGG